MDLHSLTSNCLAGTISSAFFFLLYTRVYEALLILFFLPILDYLSVSDIYPPLLLDSVSSYSQSSSAFNLLCYIDFLTVDPCIFVAYSYSSAFHIEHYLTMFLFEAGCCE